MELVLIGHTACPVCRSPWAHLILWEGDGPLLDCRACRASFPVRLEVAVPPEVKGAEATWVPLPWHRGTGPGT